MLQVAGGDHAITLATQNLVAGIQAIPVVADAEYALRRGHAGLSAGIRHGEAQTGMRFRENTRMFKSEQASFRKKLQLHSTFIGVQTSSFWVTRFSQTASAACPHYIVFS